MISLDDEDTIKEYNEPLEFYTYDIQPLDVFLKLAAAKQDDPAGMIKALRPMILTDKGEPIIKGEHMIPTHILVKCITKLVERLGK